MSNKCEWVDREFKPCHDGKEYFKDGTNCFNLHENDYIGIRYCPFCGADIRKPEPELIIKKSGNTWVARYEGVDYLCVEPNKYKGKEVEDKDFIWWVNSANGTIWKPISEIEITDSIALLRPMVIGKHITALAKLISVDKLMAFPYVIVEEGKELNITKGAKLATVGDID